MGERAPASGSAIPLVGITLALTAASAALLVDTVGVRLRRDVARLVLEDRLEVLDSARWRVAGSERMLLDAEGAPEPPHDRPYLVISLEERHLWYKQRGSILFSTEVATGSGKTMVKEGGASVWKFETPRGRLVVQSKEEAPVWAPPDWHYVEQSRKRGLGLARLEIGQSLGAADGSGSRWRETTSCGRFPTDGGACCRPRTAARSSWTARCWCRPSAPPSGATRAYWAPTA